MQARKAVPAVHSTLVFERSVPADIQAVYEAFSDVSKRVVWGTPSSTAVVLYESANFMEGGEDRFKCGSKENPNILATTRYLEIVVNARIVASETLEVDGNRLCASLTTHEFTPSAQGTELKSTVQIVSFVGEAMIDGFEQGNNSTLDNLVRWFQRQ